MSENADPFDANNTILDFENGHTVTVEDLDLSVSNSTTGTENATVPADLEFEGSFSVELETQEVVCPHCNQLNHLPKSGALRLFGDEPFPCVFCGYPLL